MSSAHRPTWDPARGGEGIFGSRVNPQTLAAHTVLKLRRDADTAPASRRDLKAELERAERQVRNKRRLEKGLAPEPETDLEQDADDEPELKRRRLIQAALEADRESASESDDEDDKGNEDEKGKGKARAQSRSVPSSRSRSASPAGRSSASSAVLKPRSGSGSGSGSGSDSDSDSDSASGSDSGSDSDAGSDEDSGDDDTAALMAELDKIKRERAEEKERKDREAATQAQNEREDEIAMGNPLLNLEQAVEGANFGIKRRWDDDVIFKNQAAGVDRRDKSGYINDMTRTEFHKKFLYRFIK